MEAFWPKVGKTTIVQLKWLAVCCQERCRTRCGTSQENLFCSFFSWRSKDKHQVQICQFLSHLIFPGETESPTQLLTQSPWPSVLRVSLTNFRHLQQAPFSHQPVHLVHLVWHHSNRSKDSLGSYKHIRIQLGACSGKSAHSRFGVSLWVFPLSSECPCPRHTKSHACPRWSMDEMWIDWKNWSDMLSTPCWLQKQGSDSFCISSCNKIQNQQQNQHFHNGAKGSDLPCWSLSRQQSIRLWKGHCQNIRSLLKSKIQWRLLLHGHVTLAAHAPHNTSNYLILGLALISEFSDRVANPGTS